MRTICTNLECLQDYQVKPEALGKLTRCKQCNTIFKIEEAPEVDISTVLFETADEADAEEEDEEDTISTATAVVKTVPQKRKTKDIIAGKIQSIIQSINKIYPQLIKSYERKDNESDTRSLIDRILTDVLGYSEDEIKREHKTYTSKVDYVLAVKGQDCIVVEAKAICKPLGKKEIQQAISYGVLTGIKWVVLTNGLVWMLYRTADEPNSSHDLVFTIELLDGLDATEAEHFYLISKHGLCRSHLLEKRWQKIAALSPENLTEALLSDEVINKVRITLTKQTGYKVSNDEIAHALRSRTLLA